MRNLEVGETGGTRAKLTEEQGDMVALALPQNKEVKFSKLQTLLKLPVEAKLNLESERRVALDGDETAAQLSHKRPGIRKNCAKISRRRSTAW